MASLKRNKKTQLNLLHMMKRNAIPADTTHPKPKPRLKNPVNATPRPTAPPFFNSTMPKIPGTKRSHKVSDDAWEVADRLVENHRLTPQKRAIGEAWEAADRLMNGQRLTPPKRVFEDNAPAMEDSDDDFEPFVVTQRIARARPSATGKSSTSALRDDRASMTKRSGNRSKRTEPVGHIPSQQRSVFEQYGLPPKMASLSSSEEEDEDDHVVVFEGEKSSLSGTDNEDDRGVDDIDMDAVTIEPSQSQERPPSLFTGRKVDSTRKGGGHVQDDTDELEIDSEVCISPSPAKRIKNITNNQRSGNNSGAEKTVLGSTHKIGPKCLNSPRVRVGEAPENSSLFSEGSRRIRSVSRQPRTIGLQKCSTGSDDLLENTSPKGTTPRRRKIRQLFSSDSESSDSEKFVCQERRRRGRLKSSIPKSPSTEDSVEVQDCDKPSTGAASHSVFERRSKSSEENCALSLNDESDSSDLEIISSSPHNESATKNKDFMSYSRGRNGHELSTDRELAANHESPVRTPRTRRRNRQSPDERKQSISEYIARASPSLSPPSTLKKRRRLRRLVLAASSEEDNDVNRTEDDGNRHNSAVRPNQTSAASTALDTLSGTPRSAEWYHERDIDEFSESSSDERPASRRTVVTRAVTRRRRRAIRTSPSQRPVLNVRRNISKSFEHSPEQRPALSAAGAEGPSSERRASETPQESKTHERSDLAYDVDAEVIDLVDDDDEPLIATNESNLGSAEVNSSFSSDSDKIDSSAFDEAAPPPFNLIALCKDGESIREMKERLGEEYVIDKVTEAQENGREVFGGEEIGLTGTYNKGIFDRFSRTLGADDVTKRRAAKSVTEQALRGEYKFHYRGRERESKTGKRGGSSRRGSSRGGSSWRGKRYYAAKHRRRSSS